MIRLLYSGSTSHMTYKTGTFDDEIKVEEREIDLSDKKRIKLISNGIIFSYNKI
ncbi:hypothetical protein WN48_02550 [Eufriesea mexicana]|uniref:Uncharacterized protein n=1 Tax=Eufriesea mexicana TaxID=516756 RepID=A0A310SBP8_9HYME|nr:hypothetical protein WN48_02550 [Eufriesea mexicana]